MKSAPNSLYFDKQCEVLCNLLARPDKENPAIKAIIRYIVREAANHSSDLPGHDNKLGAERISEEARKQIQAGKRSGLIGDHAIPISVINRMLLDKNRPSVEEIKKVLKKFSLRIVITEEEDKKLKSSGLTKKMPPDWNNESLLARYLDCEIVISDIEYNNKIKTA